MEVRFYQPERRFADDPEACLIGLASQGFEQGERIAWLVDNAAAAERIDGRLWELPVDGFIPHQIAGQPHDADCAVLILPAPQRASGRSLVINQRQDACLEADRVIELIPPDPQGQAQARQRWRAYKARGIEPELVKI